MIANSFRRIGMSLVSCFYFCCCLFGGCLGFMVKNHHHRPADPPRCSGTSISRAHIMVHSCSGPHAAVSSKHNPDAFLLLGRQRERLGSIFSLYGSPNDGGGDHGNSSMSDTTSKTADQQLPVSNFNPFTYQQQLSQRQSSSSTGTFDATRIFYLRKTRMQEITNQLLDIATSSSGAGASTVAKDNETSTITNRMMEILQGHCDFLLEPLESMDAVLEPDSIYTSDMTRSQRYQVYRSNLEERIWNARNPAAKQVLQALHDFVLSHE